MTIQYKIDKLIEAKHLDKTDISKKIGISRNTVYNLSEKTAVSTIFKICSHLNITLNDLFSDEKIDDLIKRSKSLVVSDPAGEYKVEKKENCQDLRDIIDILKEQNDNNQVTITAQHKAIDTLTTQLNRFLKKEASPLSKTKKT